jgi:hypothetical protein
MAEAATRTVEIPCGKDIDSNTFDWSGVRSHLVKTNLFSEGMERYIGWST